jgi:hypothetical protein
MKIRKVIVTGNKTASELFAKYLVNISGLSICPIDE